MNRNILHKTKFKLLGQSAVLAQRSQLSLRNRSKLKTKNQAKLVLLKQTNIFEKMLHMVSTK